MSTRKDFLIVSYKLKKEYKRNKFYNHGYNIGEKDLVSTIHFNPLSVTVAFWLVNACNIK